MLPGAIRGEVALGAIVRCLECRSEYAARRHKHWFCSAACRLAWHKSRRIKALRLLQEAEAV